MLKIILGRLVPIFLAVQLCMGAVHAGSSDELFIALQQGNTDDVVALLSKGMDVNSTDRDGNTPLIYAARDGLEALAEILIRSRAKIAHRNRFGDDALMLAALHGRLAIVERLLGAGAPTERPQKSWTALSYAAFGGHVEVARRLLDKGANPNSQSEHGVTPLMVAARGGFQAFVALLLSRDADAGLLSDQGESAYDWALKAQNTEIASMLGTRVSVEVK